MSQEQKQALETLRYDLMKTEKTLKKAIKLAECCYIVNRISIDAQNQIGGVNIQEAFRNELARSIKEKSELQAIIEKALDELSAARSKILAIG